MQAATYIHRSNQEILWNTFHQIPEFMQLSEKNKERIFKDILLQMYERLSQIVPHSFSLLEYNKQTILLFRNWIHSQKIIEFDQEIERNKQRPIENAIRPMHHQTSQVKEEFDRRQDEYLQMNKKPEVPKPSELYGETYENKIENMDEVLKKYQLERNLENKAEPDTEKKESEEEKVWKYIKLLETRIFDLEQKFNVNVENVP